MAQKKHAYDLPESPSSVGWTEAKTIRLATAENPFLLESGSSIVPVDVEYETYGTLSSDKDNVILVLHALSGDAHAAGWDKNATGERAWRLKKPGWWDSVIGPGKPLDSNRYFIICSNYLGSCYGTTGPASINPETNRPYGLTFPVVTVGDWVRLQARLLDALNIDKVYAVIGGSLGGQQAIEWTLAFPERVEKSIVLAASPRLSTQGLAFNAVARFSIMNDPAFNDGNYYGSKSPDHGLAAARMLGHITYLSDEGMYQKFGRKLQNNKNKPDFGFGVEFEVESYLDYQGRTFVRRFDANSYLYITKAMDYYDVSAQWGRGNLIKACERVKSEVIVVSFSSDWLYTPGQCKEFALALCHNGKPVTYVNIPSPYGHDAFLVETDQVGNLIKYFLCNRRPAQ